MTSAQYARISITERCNLRCVYCVGAHEDAMSGDRYDLPFAQFERFARAAAECGVQKFRLTGGEPLLHPCINDMIRLLAKDLHVPHLGLTTNGFLLEAAAEDSYDAGLRSVNISLPSMDPHTFKKITGRDEPETVLRGLDKALALGYAPVKVNVVVMRGLNDDEVAGLAALAADRPIEVRFIEYMPFAENLSDFAKPSRFHVPMSETMDRIAETAEMTPSEAVPLTCAARVYTVAGWTGRLGFIAPISQPFCAHCQRVRLTARGRLRACLIDGGEVDIARELASDLTADTLSGILENVMAMKPTLHHGRFAGVMSCIGG